MAATQAAYTIELLMLCDYKGKTSSSQYNMHRELCEQSTDSITLVQQDIRIAVCLICDLNACRYYVSLMMVWLKLYVELFVIYYAFSVGHSIDQ